jgi:hypothetical protein
VCRARGSRDLSETTTDETTPDETTTGGAESATPAGETEVGSAPGRFDAGHALLVTDVSGTYENGTAVPGIKGVGGVRANVVEGPPAGSHLIEFGLPSYRDRNYQYWLVSERIEPPE